MNKLITLKKLTLDYTELTITEANHYTNQYTNRQTNKIAYSHTNKLTNFLSDLQKTD
jgi:hypothetical protein